MEFPRFDGSNPEEWLRMTEKYFNMVHVPENAKFDYAQMYITGRADTWLRNSGVLEENLDWKEFCNALMQRFSTTSSYEAVEEFNSIRQGFSSVSDYTDKFEDKMANYRKENPDVKEAYYVKCYINGLHGEIKHYMKPHKPATLYEAVAQAKDFELGMQATAQSHNRRLNAANQSNFTAPIHPRPTSSPDNNPKKDFDNPRTRPEAKFNEPGQCKYCGQKWFFGHRCQQYKSLNVMTADSPQDQEEEEFHDLPQEVTNKPQTTPHQPEDNT